MAAPSSPEHAAAERPDEGADSRPYQSLYRRFRPQRFAEVRGQHHVTLALRNAVRDDRVTHAYLFSGPRGTGKTSTARILAKALNCETPDDGEPCGRCPSCVSIANGSSFDVHELDAASNNGVEAMRDLVARAQLATPGRWKVYIVDEVHMLSTAASNALLKTLEEPPEHVVFVLATTDPQKVIPTIRSRTQHFEFHLLPDDELEALLESVATGAELELPEGALRAALRKGRGSARDALSALDQVAASGVADDDAEAVADLGASLGNRDTAAALAALDRAIRSGRDPHQVAIELVERLRAGFLSLVAPGTTLEARGEVGALEEARSLGPGRCVRAMELVGAAIVDMRDAPEPRITLEVALIRCTHPEADDSSEGLVDRMAALERRVSQLGAGGGAVPGDVAPAVGTPAPPPRASAPAAPSGTPAPPPRASAPAAPSGAAPPPAATGADATGADAPSRDELVAAWGDRVLVGLRPKARAIYQAGRFVGTDGAEAIFALPNPAHISHAEPLRVEVAEAMSACFGRKVGLRLVVDGDWTGTERESGVETAPPGPSAPGPSAPSGPTRAEPRATTPPAAPAAPSPADQTDPNVSGERRKAGAPDRQVADRPVPGPSSTGAASGSFTTGEDALGGENFDDIGTAIDGDEANERGGLASGLSWAEDRLLQAFPGAEEI